MFNTSNVKRFHFKKFTQRTKQGLSHFMVFGSGTRTTMFPDSWDHRSCGIRIRVCGFCRIFFVDDCWQPLFHVLTVNFSMINWVLAPCSIHILFNSNKFNEFWIGCACRNPLSKDGRNQRKSRPPGHSVPTGLTPPHTWVQYFYWSNVTCS